MTQLNQQLLLNARKRSVQSRQPVFAVLQELTQLDETTLLGELAQLFHYRTLNLLELNKLSLLQEVISYPDAVKYRCVAVCDTSGQLLLVMDDPFNQDTRTWLQARVRQASVGCLVYAEDLTAYLEIQERQIRAVDNVLLIASDNRDEQSAMDISLHSIQEDSSPVVKLVNSALYDALKAGASDIHLESGAHGMLIKNRIDGVMSHIGEIRGRDRAEQVISRIKILSELNIAEHRIPQDGRFKAFLQGREVDFRVSIMPCIFGEDAVLRILDKKALSDEVKGFTLDNLGFEAATMQEIRRLANEPYGMLLMTGPTGSGKTTTLYALLSEVNSGLDKIITIEDPVEYQLPGILQIPVNEKKGLTFALGLRSILRHDPDKIMVGEIRDAETAHIAVQSALTGHLVFSSVHANNAFDVMNRFMHMKVDPFSFVSALNGVLAQRLLRVNCIHCSEPYWPDKALLHRSGLSEDDIEGYEFLHGTGCAECHGSGYIGRKAIAEILLLNDELRELIINRASMRQIKEAARLHGTRSLRESALYLVERGVTTLEEINRVTFVE